MTAVMMATTMLAVTNPAHVACAAGPDSGAQAAPDAALDSTLGWRTLTRDDFRGYKKDAFPAKGWTFENGILTSAKGGGGGDLVTKDQFSDFELELEFRTTPKGNSGLMYRVGETLGATWMTGPEYQVLDDAGHDLKPGNTHAAGGLYDIAGGPETKPLKGPGEWNSARIRLRDGVVEHWLNGTLVVSQRMFDDTGAPTPEWLAKIAGSKFKDYAGFGVLPKGHLAIQDHGDEIAFRSIRVRDLGAKGPGEVALFNGADLTGWTPVLPSGGKPEDVWSVRDGVLICTGSPVGYIRTSAMHTNYVLRLKWRFNPVTKKAGNSGVLLRVQGPDKVWPRSVEAQLMSENAGDFWNIDEFRMKADPARTKGRNTKKLAMAERPVGEWNEYEIIVNKGVVALYVNGQLLNRADDVEEISGWIALQSEGAEIHFKDVRLIPLDAPAPRTPAHTPKAGSGG
ncbi:MAG: DUF1080 domain-containing protein [Planctomycetota bacterium]|nr:DUF1080 domain-containing protein [Planctomycetota bacterium]